MIKKEPYIEHGNNFFRIVFSRNMYYCSGIVFTDKTVKKVAQGNGEAYR
jgi:hypothetical protein